MKDLNNGKAHKRIPVVHVVSSMESLPLEVRIPSVVIYPRDDQYRILGLLNREFGTTGPFPVFGTSFVCRPTFYISRQKKIRVVM